MTRKLQEYKRRYERAKAHAYEWWSVLEACYHYCIPNRNLFYYTNRTQGAQKNIKVYDTTQVSATKNFVSKVHSALTPPQQTWASFESSEAVPEEFREELDRDLQEYTDTMFSYIRGSNFDLAINECYYDLAVGTAVLVVNEGPDDDTPLVFGSIPLDQVAIEESINHRVETCFRTWGEIRIADIESVWPNARLTETMRMMLKEDAGALTKDLVEAVIHDPVKKDKPFTYILWSMDDILLEEEHESSEFVIFRWSKINNEIFGRGPIMDALPSIISLQTAAYFEMTAANLNIAKPYMGYSDGIFNPNTFKMAPNAIIPVSPNTNGQFPLVPLPDVANPAFMQITTMDLRQQINKLMFADPLGPVADVPSRTATEIALRQRNLAEEIGPLFTRLQQEFLERVLDRVSYILVKKGLIARPKVNQKEIKIKYKSPLTISQGQQDVSIFMQYMQAMAGLMGPEASQMYVNTAEYPSWLAKKMGVDPNLVNTKENVEAQMQQMLMQQQQQQQMDQMQQMQQMQGVEEGLAPPDTGE
jgi:hypothetical protein